MLFRSRNVYHEHLFPALWEKFGKSSNCSSMVLDGHSMGVPSIVIAAALHAQENAPAYPLSGIILSGAILVAAARSQTGIHMCAPMGPNRNYTELTDELTSHSGDSIIDSFVLYVINTGASS